MVKHKEGESESEEESSAREPRFRVRVCMSRVFRDWRARAYVCVSPRRRVAWLQRRLRRLFALPALRLRSRGHLLPPAEPLALLERDDPVEVIPVAAEDDARDVLDSVGAEPVATERLERSASPASLDALSETKRRALLMLEQYSAGPAPDAAERPRRRRVRRRRRAPPSAEPESGDRAELVDQAELGDQAEPGDQTAAAPSTECSMHGKAAGEELGADRWTYSVQASTSAGSVLRTGRPRAPRVVRPLAHGGPPTPGRPLAAPPARGRPLAARSPPAPACRTTSLD